MTKRKEEMGTILVSALGGKITRIELDVSEDGDVANPEEGFLLQPIEAVPTEGADEILLIEWDEASISQKAEALLQARDFKRIRVRSPAFAAKAEKAQGRINDWKKLADEMNALKGEE